MAIRYSCSCLSRSVITRRCLPLVSLPKLTVPVTSASMPASFGERASKSSATRGRPPVMSRVFETSCGMRASTSPTCTCWPSRTAITAPTGKLMFTAWSVPAMRTSSPASLMSLTEGRWPLLAAVVRRLASITTRVERPVTSSICLATVAPSSTCSNFTVPAYSVMIGRWCGSQVASCLPARTVSPSAASSARRTAPCGARARGRCRRR